jgi:hypothetical protein
MKIMKISELTIAGQDPGNPIYGVMKVIASGEIGEFAASRPDGFIELKMGDGVVRKFHRRELDFAD